MQGAARVLVGMMLAATVAAAAHGQDYPTRPIKMLVPAAPGGIGDILPRIFGQKLAESGSHTVVVENRTAGAGVVAAEAIAKAPPDGYTLLVGNQGLLSIRPQLAKVPYDPVKDFAPIVLLVSVPNILVVHPSVPAQSLQELLAYARANPGKLTYSSQGIGASGHIAAELLKLAAGVDITHVPFRGAAPAAQALAAGHVHMMFDVVSLALGPINRAQCERSASRRRNASACCPMCRHWASKASPARSAHGSGCSPRRHAASRDRLAQPRGQPRVHNPGYAQAVRRPGRRHATRQARGLHAAHRRQHGAVRRSDPAR